MQINVNGYSYDYPLTIPEDWDWYVLCYGTDSTDTIMDVVIGDHNDENHVLFENGEIVRYNEFEEVECIVEPYVKPEKKNWWEYVQDWWKGQWGN